MEKIVPNERKYPKLVERPEEEPSYDRTNKVDRRLAFTLVLLATFAIAILVTVILLLVYL